MKTDTFDLVIFAALGGLLFLIGGGMGRSHGRNDMHVQAVQAGHAYWAVRTDGSTAFVWKESCK